MDIAESLDSLIEDLLTVSGICHGALDIQHAFGQDGIVSEIHADNIEATAQQLLNSCKTNTTGTAGHDRSFLHK